MILSTVAQPIRFVPSANAQPHPHHQRHTTRDEDERASGLLLGRKHHVQSVALSNDAKSQRLLGVGFAKQ